MVKSEWIFCRVLSLLIPLCGLSYAEAGVVCPANEVACNGSTLCIPHKYLCDGASDCPDHGDEKDCSLHASGCGGASMQSGLSGAFSSMNYPQSYSNMADCRWQIEVPRGRTIRIKFEAPFELEKPRRGRCDYDSVTVYQDDPLKFIGRYCGSGPPPDIDINSHRAIVQFMSDRQTVGKGFRLTWIAQEISSTSSSTITTTTATTTTITTTTTPTSTMSTTTPLAQCSFIVNKGGLQGDIKSPSLYDVSSDSPAIHCRWHIQVNGDSLILLTFKEFNLGRICFKGKVRIHDGADNKAPLLASLCGSTVPSANITSSSNDMFVEMIVIDHRRLNKAFAAEYFGLLKPKSTTLPPPPRGCDGTGLEITSRHGTITSPGFDSRQTYQKNLDCQWNFIASPGMTYTFTFTSFLLEDSYLCRYDYLRIVENGIENGTLASSQLAKLCGLSLPLDITATKANVSIRFHSDDQVGDLGFNITYRMEPFVKCEDDEFKCGTTQCINSTLVCNGQMDCSDGSDELLCLNMTGCGVPTITSTLNDPRIVGGEVATKGSWPWVVSILDAKGVHQCGATLIHPEWVITAAHCFDKVINGQYNSYSIIAGRYQLNHSDRNEQRRYIDDFFKPRTYDLLTSADDIALIRVTPPFNMTSHVGIACLPEDRIETGEYGWILGWGKTLNASCCQGRLKQSTVPVITHSVCAGPKYYGDRVKAHMMCAGYPDGGTDSCDGDSGGPLVRRRVSDGLWELQGVTSWGVFCAVSMKPGVYTVVADYISWIQRVAADAK